MGKRKWSSLYSLKQCGNENVIQVGQNNSECVRSVSSKARLTGRRETSLLLNNLYHVTLSSGCMWVERECLQASSFSKRATHTTKVLGVKSDPQSFMHIQREACRIMLVV